MLHFYALNEINSLFNVLYSDSQSEDSDNEKGSNSRAEKVFEDSYLTDSDAYPESPPMIDFAPDPSHSVYSSQPK